MKRNQEEIERLNKIAIEHAKRKARAIEAYEFFEKRFQIKKKNFYRPLHDWQYPEVTVFNILSLKVMINQKIDSSLSLHSSLLSGQSAMRSFYKDPKKSLDLIIQDRESEEITMISLDPYFNGLTKVIYHLHENSMLALREDYDFSNEKWTLIINSIEQLEVTKPK